MTNEEWLRECEAHNARMAQNEAVLKEYLFHLRNACDAGFLPFTIGSCGLGVTPVALEALLACTAALEARVAILENQ